MTLTLFGSLNLNKSPGSLQIKYQRVITLPALGIEKALEQVKKGKGTQFDPDVVAYFDFNRVFKPFYFLCCV